MRLLSRLRVAHRLQVHEIDETTTGERYPTTLGFIARTASVVGARGSNQDRALVAGSLVAVADGVGGSVRGDVAAQVVLGRIGIDGALSGTHVPPAQAVRALVDGAHEQAIHAAGVFGSIETSSTLALVHLSRWDGDHGVVGAGEEDTPRDDRDELSEERPPEPVIQYFDGDGEVLVTCAWVGDSPVFVTDGERVRLLTVPHTDAPDGHAGKGFALMRALGGVDGTPDLASVVVRAPTRLVLSSDGLLDVPRDEVTAVIADLEQDADECLALLLVLVESHGVRDNTTIAIVDVLRTERRQTLSHVL